MKPWKPTELPVRFSFMIKWPSTPYLRRDTGRGFILRVEPETLKVEIFFVGLRRQTRSSEAFNAVDYQMRRPDQDSCLKIFGAFPAPWS